jgi:hypothetical protein
MRRRTAVVWLIWFVNVFAFYGFFIWIPTLLIQQGITVTKSFDFSLLICSRRSRGTSPGRGSATGSTGSALSRPACSGVRRRRSR